MTQAIIRDLKAARLLAFLVATIFVAGSAHGQGPIRVDIPYPFSTSSDSAKPLPAGTYFLTVEESRLVVRSSKGDQETPSIITRLSGPNSFLQAGALVFDSTGGRKVLSEVWLPGSDGILIHSIPKGHTRSVVSFSDLSVNGHASGKAAFDLTCARCHGEGGKGNPEADRFFGTTIPRLNSPEVQSKSDAELRAIIAAGTQKMPPVEVEEAGFRHRLPPQDVDAVIAYLRTLKP